MQYTKAMRTKFLLQHCVSYWLQCCHTYKTEACHGVNNKSTHLLGKNVAGCWCCCCARLLQIVVCCRQQPGLTYLLIRFFWFVEFFMFSSLVFCAVLSKRKNSFIAFYGFKWSNKWATTTTVQLTATAPTQSICGSKNFAALFKRFRSYFNQMWHKRQTDSRASAAHQKLQ